VSAMRDRSPAFDQTAPPIPGRRGRTWSLEERTSSFERAPFDRIEVRGLADDEIDLRDPATGPDAGPPDADDRSTPGDEHGPDGGEAAGPRDEAVDVGLDLREPSETRDEAVDVGLDLREPSETRDEAVDVGLDLREPSETRDDRPGAATEGVGDGWSDDGRFGDLAYTGGVRYPPVGDAAPADEEAVEDTAVDDTAAEDAVVDAADADVLVTVDDASTDLDTDVESEMRGGAGDLVTTDRPDPGAEDDAGAWSTGDLGVDQPADAVRDDIWVPDDTTAAPAADAPPPAGLTDDDPLVEVAPPVDDDRSEGGTDAKDDMRADEPDAAPVLEVRRRASQRDGGNGTPANARPPAGRALLRAERPPVLDDAARSSTPSSSPATTNNDVTDEHGVTLTAAEREARAARDRLSRFQQAVQQGRSQTRRRRNGDEFHDA